MRATTSFICIWKNKLADFFSFLYILYREVSSWQQFFTYLLPAHLNSHFENQTTWNDGEITAVTQVTFLEDILAFWPWYENALKEDSNLSQLENSQRGYDRTRHIEPQSIINSSTSVTCVLSSYTWVIQGWANWNMRQNILTTKNTVLYHQFQIIWKTGKNGALQHGTVVLRRRGEGNETWIINRRYCKLIAVTGWKHKLKAFWTSAF